MKVLLNLFSVLILVTGILQANEPSSSKINGSICLAPVRDDGDGRGYVSGDFAVRFDNDPWIAVPSETPVLFPDLKINKKHLVTIRDKGKIIQSFWFRFDKFESNNLCLWYKPWYQTWSLWTASDGGQKCQCQPTENERTG